MSWSFKVITVHGIPIRVHASFLLILLWAAYLGLTSGRGDWPRGVVFMVAFTVLLFVCVVLHELGHSLVAQLFGVKVQDITLWPVGGVARIAHMPEKPLQEFLVTAAGPAVNVILALGLGLLALAWIGPQTLLDKLGSNAGRMSLVQILNGQTLVLLLALQNALLVAFNLIPAFPMDGGRLLRSFLAAFLPFGLATRIASFIGQAIAVILVLVSLLPGIGGLFLTFIGLFVFLSAWQERQQVVSMAGLRGVRVRQAMQPLGVRLHPLETLGDALARVAATPQGVFLVVDAGRVAGVITHRELLLALRKAGPAARVQQHLTTAFAQIGPDDLLLDVQDRLQVQHAGVVVVDGQVVGLLGTGDLARLAEALTIYPQALNRD
jgi:Zn-dependent protease/CBS domain-containing protein